MKSVSLTARASYVVLAQVDKAGDVFLDPCAPVVAEAGEVDGVNLLAFVLGDVAIGMQRDRAGLQIRRQRGSWGHQQQNPRNSRRNVLPTERMDWPLLMRHEHLACALIELMQITQTPSRSDGVFHRPPEAFDRIEVVTTVRW